MAKIIDEKSLIEIAKRLEVFAKKNNLTVLELKLVVDSMTAYTQIHGTG